MNRIKTSDILDPSTQMPLTGPSLNFLQTGINEILMGIVAGINNDVYDTGNPLIICGLKKSLISGTTWLITQGYVLISGEIYYVPGVVLTLSGANVFIINIVVTNDAVADPVEFTDGTYKNVNNIRRVNITQGLTGTGLFDFNNLVSIYSQGKTKIIQIGDWNMQSSTSVSITHGL